MSRLKVLPEFAQLKDTTTAATRVFPNGSILDFPALWTNQTTPVAVRDFPDLQTVTSVIT